MHLYSQYPGEVASFREVLRVVGQETGNIRPVPFSYKDFWKIFTKSAKLASLSHALNAQNRKNNIA